MQVFDGTNEQMKKAAKREKVARFETDEAVRSPASDRDLLIKAAVNGDPAAVHDLIVELLPRVRNQVRYLIRGEEAVDDIAQDALVTVMNRLSSFRGEGSLESWVDGVALRVILVSRRRRRVWLSRIAPQTPEALSGETESSPESYPDRRRSVMALDALPDKQRIALVMHYVLGMTVPEIATELRIPSETVRSRLRLGMSRLRALLDIGRTDEMR